MVTNLIAAFKALGKAFKTVSEISIQEKAFMNLGNNIDYTMAKKVVRIGGIVFLALFLSFGWVLYFTEDRPFDYHSESKQKAISKLEDSFKSFKSLSGKQIHAIWNDLFYNVEYKQNPAVRENKYDCSTALWSFFKYVGSNAALEDTLTIQKRLQKGNSKPYTSIRQVREGDLILFNRISDQGHIAIVEKVDVNKNSIRYIDVNVYSDGAGYSVIKFGDGRIAAIYPVTFDFWCGNILSE